eukprot:11085790-Ditylum_brightwellii.AAC.1
MDSASKHEPKGRKKEKELGEKLGNVIEHRSSRSERTHFSSNKICVQVYVIKNETRERSDQEDSEKYV